MNIKDFKKLEAKLGHPPTQKEVRQAETPAVKPKIFKSTDIQICLN